MESTTPESLDPGQGEGHPALPLPPSDSLVEGSTRSARRRFIATAGGATVAAAASAITNAPFVIAQPKFQWRLSTAYPPSLDQLHGAAQRLAQVGEESSSGRFRVEGFAGGQIVEAFGAFGAALEGTLEGFIASSVLMVVEGACNE